MGYLVRIWGDLSLTAAQARAWREGTADASAWNDWRGEFSRLADPRPVSALLDAYADWPGGDDEPEHLNVCVLDGRCTVRGLIDEESYRSIASALGALVRSAHGVGARGDVTFAADTGDFAYRITLDDSATRFTTVGPGEMARPSDVEARRSLDAASTERIRRAVEARAARASAGTGAVLREIVEALGTASPVSIRIATRTMRSTTSSASGAVPLAKAFRDGSVLVDEIRRGSERLGPKEQAEIAIELLCRVDRERGWDLVTRALAVRGPEASPLHVGAVRGLAVLAHRAALTQLLDAAASQDAAVGEAARDAIVTFDHPEVDRALRTALARWDADPTRAGRRSFLAEAQSARTVRPR